MKKYLLGLILSVLMTISGYSQITYPKKIVLESDTVIAITPIQLKKANKKLVRGEMFDTLYRQALNQMTELEEALRTKDTLITICRVQKEHYISKSKEFKSKLEQEETKHKKTKKQRNWLAGSSGVLTILLILVLL